MGSRTTRNVQHWQARHASVTGPASSAAFSAASASMPTLLVQQLAVAFVRTYTHHPTNQQSAGAQALIGGQRDNKKRKRQWQH